MAFFQPIRLPSGDTLRPVLSSAQRAAIETQIETLLALLDEADGDPDLEAHDDWDQSGDDGCGVVYLLGNTHWGSHYDDTPRLARPRYGIDQSRGPTNERIAIEAYLSQEGR